MKSIRELLNIDTPGRSVPTIDSEIAENCLVVDDNKFTTNNYLYLHSSDTSCMKDFETKHHTPRIHPEVNREKITSKPMDNNDTINQIHIEMEPLLPKNKND